MRAVPDLTWMGVSKIQGNPQKPGQELHALARDRAEANRVVLFEGLSRKNRHPGLSN